MTTIDLNCDMGEEAGHDQELMPLISSANIACGAHAGGEDEMERTVALALEHGVAIGAHPGYEDRREFGRRDQCLPPGAVRNLVTTQLERLLRICRRHAARLTHVKPHGALYNQSARDRAIAEEIAQAVRSVDPTLVVYGLAGSVSLEVAHAAGLRVAGEVFSDRNYRADGSLVPRSQPGALVDSEEAAIRHVLAMLELGHVISLDGVPVPLRADTLCVHGDGPHAVAFAQRLRRVFLERGIEVRSLAL